MAIGAIDRSQTMRFQIPFLSSLFFLYSLFPSVICWASAITGNNIIADSLIRFSSVSETLLASDCIGVIINIENKIYIITAPVCAEKIVMKLNQGDEIKIKKNTQIVGRVIPTDEEYTRCGLLSVDYEAKEVIPKKPLPLFMVSEPERLNILNTQQFYYYNDNGLDVEKASVYLGLPTITKERKLFDIISGGISISLGTPVVNARQDIICIVETQGCAVYHNTKFKRQIEKGEMTLSENGSGEEPGRYAMASIGIALGALLAPAAITTPVSVIIILLSKYIGKVQFGRGIYALPVGVAVFSTAIIGIPASIVTAVFVKDVKAL